MAGKKGQKKSSYTPLLGNKVCELLEQGYTLTKICTYHLPQLTTDKIFSWKRTVPEFREQYRIARESGLEVLTDKILDQSTEEIRTTDRPRTEIEAELQQRKNRIDIIKFLVTKGVNKLNHELNQIVKPTTPNLVIQNYSSSTSNVPTLEDIPNQALPIAHGTTISNEVVLLDNLDNEPLESHLNQSTVNNELNQTVKVRDWSIE